MASSTFKVGDRVLVLEVLGLREYNPFLPLRGVVSGVDPSDAEYCKVHLNYDPCDSTFDLWCRARKVGGLLDI